jgi:hypothetical protein
LKTHFLYILLLFTICKTSNAQVYYAGAIYPYYYDVSPDSLLSYDVAFFPFIEENYYIDINGDASFDLRIRSYGYHGAMYGIGYIAVYSLNANTFKRLKGTSSGYKVAHPYNLNDSINSKIAIWDNTTQYISLDETPDMSHPGANISTDWCTNNDLYLGVKFENATDTIFGWIRVNCNHPASFKADCLIKDYSFQSIYAGIEKHNSKKIKVFPNPVSNILKIENGQNNLQNSKLEIINSFGQTVLKTEFKNQIDVSELANGFYTLLIKDNSGSVITKKFVKE